MSKNKIMDLLDKDEYPKNKNLREQIMFHLSFSFMMKFSGRDETAEDHMEKCQSLIELIPDITVEHAREQYETLVALQ